MIKFVSILLFLLICLTGISSFADNGKYGSISGRILLEEDLPMSNAQVFIFNDATGAPPSFDRYWRVPDEVIQADGGGRFKAVLAEGKYYLGAIKRRSGEEIGPLQDGDLFLPFYADGAPISYQVAGGADTNLGIIYGAQPFNRKILKAGKDVTAIEGYVTDPSGKPIENALVFAFTSPAMQGKPLFISEKTGSNGRYILRVYQGGSYYLKIRNSYGGGAMRTGEIMGIYGQDQPVAVDVSTGAVVKGINITGTTFARQGQKKNMKK